MKILFITLTNIGDVILTLPVLDALRQNYPQSLITVICGARPAKIFENNPYIGKLIIFDKRSSVKDKIRLLLELKREKFDLIIDFRNSFFGFFLSIGKKYFTLGRPANSLLHMKDRHLSKLRPSLKLVSGPALPGSVYVSLEDEKYINSIWEQNDIRSTDIVIIVCAGARSHIKRWPKEKFSQLLAKLEEEFKAKIILVGNKDDCVIADYIALEADYPVLNLCDKTTLAQLAYLFKKSNLVITNDSAAMHLASYINAPVLAVFGPTSEIKYGPWPQVSAVVKKNIICRPCEKAQCRFGTLRCMHLIKVEDVLGEARRLLGARGKGQGTYRGGEYKRILVVRTDRIGDVLLSTPVLKGLRENFPRAYIAMMVSPYAKDIVELSPFVDEVITYDKDAKHKSWFRSMKFSRNLKKRGFDLALILHPVNRAHLITYFAGIKKRVGFDRKLGFLLTDRIKHVKQEGQKHELEYSLDFLRYLGLEPQDKKPFMPIKPESEEWVKQLLEKEGISRADALLAVHAGASCLSKIWPAGRFAEVADKLAINRGLKVIVVAGPRDIPVSNEMIKQMNAPAINLAGKTSVSQLASVLKRCRLFISNDSGPVHIASAVGTPVISIFGRNQKGLSPKRWGPLGDKDKILHKETDCVECLAHNCVRGFLCLNSITVDEVIEAAESILDKSSK